MWPTHHWWVHGGTDSNSHVIHLVSCCYHSVHRPLFTGSAKYPALISPLHPWVSKSESDSSQSSQLSGGQAASSLFSSLHCLKRLKSLNLRCFIKQLETKFHINWGKINLLQPHRSEWGAGISILQPRHLRLLLGTLSNTDLGGAAGGATSSCQPWFLHLLHRLLFTINIFHLFSLSQAPGPKRTRSVRIIKRGTRRTCLHLFSPPEKLHRWLANPCIFLHLPHLSNL